jgi:DNA repair exonuclease SbcCD ATPase subunit
MSNDRNLHGQIEDLLTALSEMQRDHAILATQLQKEREEREEDRHAVRSLLDGLRNKTSSETVTSAGSDDSVETIAPLEEDDAEDIESGLQGDGVPEVLHKGEVTVVREDIDGDFSRSVVTGDDISKLLKAVEAHFGKRDNRRSSMLQSKSQLRDELARSKEQLIFEVSKAQELSRRLNEMEQDVLSLKEQVREGHNHVRNARQEKQRLEKQIHDLRSRKTPVASPNVAAATGESEWPKRGSGHGGLRELRLGRTNSNSSQTTTFGKRISSLNTQVPYVKENDSPISIFESSSTPPAADIDALVAELVQAKTAKAIAEQEAEEAKAKLDSLRKMLGIQSSDSLGHRSSPSQPNIEKSVTLGAFSSYMSRTSESRVTSPPVSTPSSSTSAGGFWGAWGKRTVSTEKVAVVQDKI